MTNNYDITSCAGESMEYVFITQAQFQLIVVDMGNAVGNCNDSQYLMKTCGNIKPCTDTIDPVCTAAVTQAQLAELDCLQLPESYLGVCITALVGCFASS